MLYSIIIMSVDSMVHENSSNKIEHNTDTYMSNTFHVCCVCVCVGYMQLTGVLEEGHTFSAGIYQVATGA